MTESLSESQETETKPSSMVVETPEVAYQLLQQSGVIDSDLLEQIQQFVFNKAERRISGFIKKNRIKPILWTVEKIRDELLVTIPKE